jgi:hypothetical protein
MDTCYFDEAVVRGLLRRHVQVFLAVFYANEACANGDDGHTYYSTPPCNSVWFWGLVQLVRFLIVKSTHSDLNFIFDMCITFTTNYFFKERQCLCR